MSPKAQPEPEEVRRARMRRQMEAYEQAHPDMIPGSSSHDGREATGGRFYADAARMAKAREGAGLPLTDTDREALRRHPIPTGYVGE